MATRTPSGSYKTLGEIEELMSHLPGHAWSGEMGRLPWWLTQAARKASLFLSGQPIALVTGAPYKPPTFDTTRNGIPVASRPGRFVVFGDRHVVISEIVEGSRPDEARTTTTTQLVGRHALVDVHPVEATISSEPNGRFWPHEQDLRITYRGVDSPINLLPEGTTEHSSVLEVVQQFIPSLLDDLAGAK